MLDRTQAQVMQSWKSGEDCIVSVVCATYNHEAYIREAINSFLMQETDFPFEIVIHDDASTDDTPNIIRKYQALYPEIIKPIFQKENQYSKGKFKPSGYAAGYSRGKYIALCEGDDFWLDDQKINKQLVSFFRYPDCDMCFHPARIFHNDAINNNTIINKFSPVECVFSLEKIIKGGGGFCPTASLMFKRHIFDTMPPWFYDAPVGDYYYQVFGAKKGGAIYLPDIMSIYRYGGAGSLNTMTSRDNPKNIEEFIAKDMVSLDKLAINLGAENASSINWRKAAVCTGFSFIPLGQGDFSTFKKLIEQSWQIQKRITRLQTIIYSMRNFPLPLMLLLKIKRRLFSSTRFFGTGWGLRNK